MKLTPKEAAEVAQVSSTLIYQWCDEGLPHYRFGGKGKRGRIFIDPADLERFIESKKVTEPTEDEWP
jgi:excisionase family DNA binding protein